MARYDFCINQGADILLPILLKDSSDSVIKLNGFKVRMQIRQYKHSETAIDTLTTENGRIVLDPEEGKFTLKFPNKVTSQYPAVKAVYDIETVSADGKVTRILEGTVLISKEVTRV